MLISCIGPKLCRDKVLAAIDLIPLQFDAVLPRERENLTCVQRVEEVLFSQKSGMN